MNVHRHLGRGKEIVVPGMYVCVLGSVCVRELVGTKGLWKNSRLDKLFYALWKFSVIYSNLYLTIIAGSHVRIGLAEEEKDGLKAVWEAIERPWAVALGVERKDIPENPYVGVATWRLITWWSVGWVIQMKS